MKKIILFFICFLFLNLPGHSQYKKELTDLLIKVKDASYHDSSLLFRVGEQAKLIALLLNQKNALAEIDLYYGNYFFYMHQMERANTYFLRALQKAEKYNDSHLQTLAKIRLVYVEDEKESAENILQKLNLLLEEAKKQNDYKNTVEIINFLASIKTRNNEIQEAIKLYLEGIALSETYHLEYYPFVFKNNLGLIKFSVGQFDEALKDFESVIEGAKKEGNNRLLNNGKINKCIVLIQKNKIPEALNLINEVLDYSRTNNMPRESAVVYLNIGSAFISSNKLENALPYLDSAIYIFKKQDLKYELTRAYVGKAQVLVSLKKHAEAYPLLKSVKELSDKTGNLEDLASYYNLIYTIESDQNKYKGALENYLMYIKIKDSLAQIVNGKIIEELQLKYNVQKKEIELEKEKSKSILLEKTNEKEKFIKWLIIGIAIVLLILIFGISFIRYNRILRVKQAQFSRNLIQNIEAERHRISRDLHDDIGQSLSVIKSKIVKEHHEKLIPSTELENELGRVIEQTREISRNLFPTNLEKIGLTRTIAGLMENIQNATKLECSYEITEKEKELSIAVKTHIYRIIQECTNNTIKHSGASGLKISIEEKNGEFSLIYLDNGAGLKIKKDHIGIGLLSMQERAKIINGYIEIDDKTQKGFKLMLKFKSIKNEFA